MMFSKWFSSRKSPVTKLVIKEDNLGRLEYDDDLGWKGAYTIDGREVEITVDGSELAPNPNLVNALKAWLDNSTVAQKILFNFIESELKKNKHLQELKADDFTLTSIDFLWENQPDHFFVYLSTPEEEHKLWRVEYIDGKPTYLGFDG